MHWIDWSIAVLPLVICGFIAVYTRRYVHGVADFLAGGRTAGRYLICTARAERTAGVVVLVAIFQTFMVAGFTMNWWSQLAVPVGLIVAITGFVIYRYRETRALTLAQFFEMRYSRNFRLFTGALGFFAGIVNFGVIPMIGSRFFILYLNLPQHILLFHFIFRTDLLLMGLFLLICVVMTTTGGQISVLLTDCTAGAISQVFYVMIAVMVLIVFFKWSATKSALLATPPGQSLVNPFDSFGLKDFNIWFVLMGIYISVYSTMAWQHGQAFNASAISAHEARMGNLLGNWRSFAESGMALLLSVCALTYLKTPHGSAAVAAAMTHIKDPSTISQMRVPVALSQILPTGAKGAFVALCLIGLVGGDGIHLHSWGSILVQDVIMPLRKKPLTTRQHLILLRLAICGVAVWAFVFGAVFPQTNYIRMWWAITQAVFTGGAGAAIIGGLYWSKGTTAGAWTGLLVGSSLSVGGICVGLYWRTHLGHEFFLNGQQLSFFATILAMLSYIGVSWLTCKHPHNMDRLLHRGEFAVEPATPSSAPAIQKKKKISVYRLLGIDQQFTRGDRWITLGIFSWSLLWFAAFIIGSIVYLAVLWTRRLPDSAYNGIWADYYLITGIFLPLVIGIITAIWFTVGCWLDICVFFRRLRAESVNSLDDGTVTHGPLDEDLATLPEAVLSPVQTDEENCCGATPVFDKIDNDSPK